MTDFEKKMHHDGRLYGWAMLIAICAFPFFASVRSGIWPDFKIIWPGVLTMWILMASYVLSEMIAFPPRTRKPLFDLYYRKPAESENSLCVVSNEYSWYRSWK